LSSCFATLFITLCPQASAGKEILFLGCISSVNSYKVPMEPSRIHEPVRQQVVTHSILYTFKSTCVCGVCKYQGEVTYIALPLLLRTAPVPCQRARVTVYLHCSRRLGMMINTCHTFATAVPSAAVLSSLFKLPPYGHRSITKNIKSGFASPVMTLKSRNKFKPLKWK